MISQINPGDDAVFAIHMTARTLAFSNYRPRVFLGYLPKDQENKRSVSNLKSLTRWNPVGIFLSSPLKPNCLTTPYARFLFCRALIVQKEKDRCSELPAAAYHP